ncbi:MAG TPA: hypothetical protein VMW35_11330 [Myxococcota bacterium]|jgi:hypothetical protein|nr:hypothetical protein [Myxococcota bacterium]
MADTFRLLGVLLACYVVYGVGSGHVYGKSGVWGRTYVRDDDPWGYWGTIGAYSALTFALLFLF